MGVDRVSAFETSDERANATAILDFSIITKILICMFLLCKSKEFKGIRSGRSLHSSTFPSLVVFTPSHVSPLNPLGLNGRTPART